jgi:hypothetical protein
VRLCRRRQSDVPFATSLFASAIVDKRRGLQNQLSKSEKHKQGTQNAEDSVQRGKEK